MTSDINKQCIKPRKFFGGGTARYQYGQLLPVNEENIRPGEVR